MSFYDLFNFHIFYFLIFFFYIQDLFLTISYCYWSHCFLVLNPNSVFFPSFLFFILQFLDFFTIHFLYMLTLWITLLSFPVRPVFEPHPYSSYPDRPHRRHRIHHYPYADHIWRYQFFHFLLNLSMFFITSFLLSDVVSWFSLIYNNIHQHV